MSEPHYILIACIIGGALLAVAAPRLTRVRLFLPLSRAPFGKALALIAEEAFAILLLSVGLRGLLGDSSPFATVLDAVKAIAFISFGMVVIGGWVGEVIHGVQHRDEVGET